MEDITKFINQCGDDVINPFMKPKSFIINQNNILQILYIVTHVYQQLKEDKGLFYK
jgi:hypothetical protein